MTASAALSKVGWSEASEARVLLGAEASTIERLAGSGVLERGLAHVVGLEPIRARLGDRWPRKQEQVWEHFRKYFERHLSAHDLVLRLDETHLLVAQPAEQPSTALAVIMRLTSEVVGFFLGEATARDIHVSMATAVQDGALVCEAVRVDPGVTFAEPTRSFHPDGAPPAKKRKSLPLLTRLGRRLTLELTLEPIHDLQRGTVIGHHVRKVARDADRGILLTRAMRDLLQPGDLLDLDIAALGEGLGLRAMAPRSAGGLLIPMSYRVASNSRTRFDLLHELRDGGGSRESFAWEMIDLESGCPAGRLADIVALMRPHCRGVVCRVSPGLNTGVQLRRAGATASLQLFDQSQREQEQLLRVAGVLQTLGQSVPAIMVHDMPARLMSNAAVLGVTHCTLAKDPE